MSLSFDDLSKSLSQTQLDILEKILEDETRQKRREILNHIEVDQKHLEIVNFCANFFIHGQLIPEKTGYCLTLTEPLYSLGVKNFDLGIFRSENSSLILVECKSSVSDFGKLVDDLEKSITTATERKSDLEKILGNQIMDPIEFALCLPAVDANDAYKETLKKQIPICVWGASQFEGKIKHFANQDKTTSEIQAGRLHRDGNLNSLLARGVESKCRAIRSIPILPSSHMCTLLVYVGELIYLANKSQRKHGEFQYSDVFSILEKDLGHMTSLSEEDFARLTTNILSVGLRKGVFIDLTTDIPEPSRKIIQIGGRKTSAEIVRKNIENVYVEHNAKEKAKENAVTRYKKETGTTSIMSFMGPDDRNNRPVP